MTVPAKIRVLPVEDDPAEALKATGGHAAGL